MLVRFNILPQYKKDLIYMIALLIYWIIMYYYYFELLLPVIHDETNAKKRGYNHNLVYMISLFVGSNAICNWVAIMLMDTSVDCKNMRSGNGWHYCSTCKILVPPRAWHCRKCNICIVKRDHHCMFSGYCIGHNNQRYYLMFLLYSLMLAFFINIYGNLFLWRTFIKENDKSVNYMLEFYRIHITYKFLKPFCQWHILAYVINLYSLIFTAKLLNFYIPLAYKGALVFQPSVHSFDEGYLQNIKSIFGVRFYLVWISPIICSALPQNGCEWKSNRRRY